MKTVVLKVGEKVENVENLFYKSGGKTYMGKHKIIKLAEQVLGDIYERDEKNRITKKSFKFENEEKGREKDGKRRKLKESLTLEAIKQDLKKKLEEQNKKLTNLDGWFEKYDFLKKDILR